MVRLRKVGKGLNGADRQAGGRRAGRWKAGGRCADQLRIRLGSSKLEVWKGIQRSTKFQAWHHEGVWRYGGGKWQA
eukprot:5506-Chlamydomonas_euryale.AAC.1